MSITKEDAADVKKELGSKVAKAAVSASKDKKREVAGKMARVNLGEKKLKDFAYRVSDHKGNTLREGGSKKGLASLK